MPRRGGVSPAAALVRTRARHGAVGRSEGAVSGMQVCREEPPGGLAGWRRSRPASALFGQEWYPTDIDAGCNGAAEQPPHVIFTSGRAEVAAWRCGEPRRTIAVSCVQGIAGGHTGVVVKIKYKEESTEALGATAAKSWSAAFDPPDEPTTVLLNGPCPRCQHPSQSVWPLVIVREVVAAEDDAGAIPIPVKCRCRAEHGAPDGELGCGRYWTLTVKEPKA